MVYFKETQAKYKANNLEHYKEITRKASTKYKRKNIELVREKDRLYKRNFNEFKRLRNIELF
jgi:hypothetical protein